MGGGVEHLSSWKQLWGGSDAWVGGGWGGQAPDKSKPASLPLPSVAYKLVGFSVCI